MGGETDVRALVVTDVVDSTRITEQLGDAAMADVWRAHDRIARDLLHERAGREIDKSDGMLTVFDRVADAVEYSLSLHAAIAREKLPIQVRAGIHWAPVIVRRNAETD